MKRFYVGEDTRRPLQTVVGDKKPANWHRLLSQETLLCQVLMRYQRTFRLMKLIPSWECWVQEPVWFEIAKEMTDSADVRKFKAWYELVYIAQRIDVVKTGRDDTQAVMFALLTVTQEKAKRDSGKIRMLDCADFHITPEHAQTIQEAALRRMKDLLPCEVLTGPQDTAARLRPRYDR